MTDIAILYKENKSLLFSLAYRMLGSVMDAEDIVQETFVTFDQLPDLENITNDKAYLCKMVTNRCLDMLRSSAKKRELYVGPWLPEPLLNQEILENDPAISYLQKESLTTAYLLLLQQLNAMERAVFLLREIFQYTYEEVANMVGKSVANCRQIYRRAKKSIHFDPETIPTVTEAETQVKDFVQAIIQGNTTHLLHLIHEDVVCYNDGGGKVRAAQVPVVGLSKVMKLFINFSKMYNGKYLLRFAEVNGLPGMVIDMKDGNKYIYSFSFKGKQIKTIYTVANPEKLLHVL